MIVIALPPTNIYIYMVWLLLVVKAAAVVVVVLFILRIHFNQLGRFSRSIRIEIVENYVDWQIDCIAFAGTVLPIQ